MKPLEFQPREPVPPPPTNGSKWWHYALAGVLCGGITFYLLSQMFPSVEGMPRSWFWQASDYGPSDDDLTQQRADQISADRANRGSDPEKR